MEIEGYTDLVLIGRGGFSKVYRARQVDFNRHVAIKVLEIDVETAEARRQFERECELTGTLTGHPHIVTVLDSGYVEGSGEPYIVMEFAPGGSLSTRILERGPLGLGESLTLSIQVAGALETAHLHGIIHRDVKPENVVFQRSGAPGLVDFGIASIAGFASSTASAQAFTPLYAAPELFGGEVSTPKSDAYGLGSTLYCMLQGAAPYGQLGDLPTVVLNRVLSAPIPELTGRDVPARLRSLVRDLLSRNPDERPMVGEIISELQSIEADAGLPPTTAVVFGPDDHRGGERQDADSGIGSGVATSLPGEPKHPRKNRPKSLILAAAVGLVALLSLGGVLLLRNPQHIATPTTKTDVLAVSATDTRACSITGTGKVQCWGQDQNGELGNGTTINSTKPVLVRGIDDAIQLSVTATHACALTASGRLWCWGTNDNGQLGDGTKSNHTTPIEVKGLPGIRQVAAGEYYTCVLITDGSVDCWGDNSHGQLGRGTRAGDPQSPRAPVSGIANAIQLVTRDWSTCALIVGGSAKCWGNNEYGQLGNGTTDPTGEPVSVLGLTGATHLEQGYFHTCAILIDNTAECWGKNDKGQLGDGTTIDRDSPVKVVGLQGVRQLSLGEEHSCALLDTGSVKCWGNNEDGQLGTSTQGVQSTPTAVDNLPSGRGIAVGNFFSCASTASGLFCWGRNDNGQLGAGSKQSSPTPVAVKLR